jgi:hypothetical protein
VLMIGCILVIVANVGYFVYKQHTDIALLSHDSGQKTMPFFNRSFLHRTDF